MNIFDSVKSSVIEAVPDFFPISEGRKQADLRWQAIVLQVIFRQRKRGVDGSL